MVIPRLPVAFVVAILATIAMYKFSYDQEQGRLSISLLMGIVMFGITYLFL